RSVLRRRQVGAAVALGSPAGLRARARSAFERDRRRGPPGAAPAAARGRRPEGRGGDLWRPPCAGLAGLFRRAWARPWRESREGGAAPRGDGAAGAAVPP